MARAKSSEWKDRFTQSQLERKRHVDRVGQRRTRDQLKKTVADLTERVELLTRAQGNVIIEQLMSENEVLRDQVNEFKSKFSAIHQMSRDYMNEEENNQVAQTSSGERIKDRMAIVKATKSLEDSLKTSSRALPFLSAVLFCRSSRSVPSSPGSEDAFSGDELLDAVMSWKLSTQHGLGFDFLLNSLALDREPLLLTSKQILDCVRRKDFYKLIVEKVGQRGECTSPFAESEGIEQDYYPEMECQRRAVMLCAYEIVHRWRNLFPSHLECHAQFWGLYRLLMVDSPFLFCIFLRLLTIPELLTFPSEDSLDKTPVWMRPSREQLTYAHPGFIDCLMWPKIRRYLLHAWHRHNVQALCVAFVQCLELRGVDRDSITATLLVSPNNGGIELDPTYAAAISNLENFHLKDDLRRLFPEMASCFGDGGVPDATVAAATRSVGAVDDTLSQQGSSDTTVVDSSHYNYYNSSHHMLPMLDGFDMDGSMSIFAAMDFTNMYPQPIQGSIFSTVGPGECHDHDRNQTYNGLVVA